MKLLYIADSSSIHTQRWLRYFANKKNAVYLITLGKKESKIKGVKTIAKFDGFNYKTISSISVLNKTKKIISSIKPDILHGHFIHEYGWLAALTGFHPLVLTAWGSDILNLPNASRFFLGKALTRYSLKTADILTGTSENLVSQMKKIAKNTKETHVVHWGVDLEKFSPLIDTQKIKTELNINENQVIYSNRHFIEIYNNDIIIGAMSLVLGKFPDAVLILQNAGGPLKEQLKKLAVQKGIKKSIRFIPAFKNKDLPPLYALSDIFVSVPSWDGGPVSVTEAMASGSVPIISGVPGPTEWIKNNINGKVIPTRNEKKLAKAICELLGDKIMMDRFAKVNIEIIKNKFNHKKSMKIVEKLYNNVI